MKAVGMFAALMVALAMTGVAFACWSETLYISGTVYTGHVGAQIVAGDNYDTEPPQKDCSWISGYVEGDTLCVTVTNAYPCIDYYQEFAIINTGSIPENVVLIENTSPLPENVTVEVTGIVCPVQLEPGENVTGTVHVHVEQGAAQGSTYNFAFRIVVAQWNIAPEE